MPRLWEAVRDPAVLIAMEPEELGRHLIADILAKPDKTANTQAFEDLFGTGEDGPYPRSAKDRILEAVMDAWAWLISEGHLVPKDAYGWHRLSRRAAKLADPAQFADYQVARLLPKSILHPSLRGRVWMNTIRGDYDMAVFEAMRAVEIAVRDASAIDDLGVSLMRRAFQPNGGPLANENAEPAEKEARSHLFAGAIGSYKNPVSHKYVPLDQAGEVIEQIMLASHLLRIVDECVIARTLGAK